MPKVWMWSRIGFLPLECLRSFEPAYATLVMCMQELLKNPKFIIFLHFIPVNTCNFFLIWYKHMTRSNHRCPPQGWKWIGPMCVLSWSLACLRKISFGGTFRGWVWVTNTFPSSYPDFRLIVWLVISSVIKPRPDRWVDPVNWHLSQSEFFIKTLMLLTRKNPLKPSGFCANRVTWLGCNFYENYFFGSTFIQNLIIW